MYHLTEKDKETLKQFKFSSAPPYVYLLFDTFDNTIEQRGKNQNLFLIITKKPNIWCMIHPTTMKYWYQPVSLFDNDYKYFVACTNYKGKIVFDNYRFAKPKKFKRQRYYYHCTLYWLIKQLCNTYMIDDISQYMLMLM
ncbi:MAG TPA: hypothetical protein VLG50_02145 [Candidatus Saccharimonadales bacterium]|nr:hypothetical protein [Candidatus Saccharimonadales bacterium]